MGVGQEAFGALAGPLDAAVELLRGPGQRHVLGVQEDLGAEAAAHVGRDHPHLVLGQAQHEGRHQQPLHMRVLVGDVERVLVVGAAVAADRDARLHRVGHQPVVDEVQLRHVRRLGEDRIDLRLVAERPLVALVVGRGVMKGDAAGLLRGIRHAHHRGQHLVVDLDRLGGILGLLHRIGHHHGHVVAHVAHLADGEDGVRRLLHRGAVGVVDEPAAGQPAHLAVDVLAGEDARHAGHLRGRRGVDGLDRRMRMRRTQEHGVGLVGQVHVVGVLPGADEEAVVFLAPECLADVRQLREVGCAHGGAPYAAAEAWAGAAAMASPPICTAFTMFW
jgi:hypothetical protein